MIPETRGEIKTYWTPPDLVISTHKGLGRSSIEGLTCPDWGGMYTS